MTSLCVKFQPSSTLPSDRFWWGVLVLVLLVVLLLLVTGVKQSQLLVLRLSLEFDNNIVGHPVHNLKGELELNTLDTYCPLGKNGFFNTEIVPDFYY